MTTMITRNEKGLTLIELVVTLAVISFVLMALYAFYLNGLRSWQRSQDAMEYQQSARIAMDKIIRELRYAYDIEVHNQNREIRFKTFEDSRTLRFRLSGRELIFDSYPTGHAHYYHTKVALEIKELQFMITETGLVTVLINAGTDEMTVTLVSSVRPRNLP